MVVPTPDGVKNQMVLAAAAIAGVTRVITIGGAQAVGALAYGTATIAAGRQDRRPRQRLRGRRQAPRVRHRRHRHDRRPVRDPGAVRRHHRSGLGGDGPVLAGRARRTGAGHHAVPGRRLHRAGRGEHPQAAADHAAPGHHPHLADRPRRAGQGARHGGSLRDRQRDRRRTPRNLGREPAAVGRPDPPRRRHVPGPLLVRVAGRLLLRPEPRAADLAHRALLVAAGRVRLPEALVDHLYVSEAGAQTLGKVAAELAYGEGLQAHARSAELRIKPQS